MATCKQCKHWVRNLEDNPSAHSLSLMQKRWSEKGTCNVHAPKQSVTHESYWCSSFAWDSRWLCPECGENAGQAAENYGPSMGMMVETTCRACGVRLYSDYKGGKFFWQKA